MTLAPRASQVPCASCIMGKAFFSLVKLYYPFLTVWLVGHWLMLAMQCWNRNWVYSSVTPNAHDTVLVLVPAYCCEPSWTHFNNFFHELSHEIVFVMQIRDIYTCIFCELCLWIGCMWDDNYSCASVCMHWRFPPRNFCFVLYENFLNFHRSINYKQIFFGNVLTMWALFRPSLDMNYATTSPNKQD